jgi:hypothetical protein
MRHGTLSYVLFATVAVASSGCPGGGGDLGDPCDNTGNCQSSYQCLGNVCVPRCQRAPECGDGYSCDEDGICRVATGQVGDGCRSEADCSTGLACRLNGRDVNGDLFFDEDGLLRASCVAQNDEGRPPTALCNIDDDCRNGTCAHGRCVDLCSTTRDCGSGTSCQVLQRVSATLHDGPFGGCLQAKGVVTWTIPMTAPTAVIQFPVPSEAQSASLIFSVDDLSQRVGAQSVKSPPPEEVTLYTKPCEPGFVPGGPMCTAEDAATQFYKNNLVRHAPELGQSVLMMPSSPDVPLEPGAYEVRVSSYRANGTGGSAIPHVTGMVRIGPGLVLDLHFHFLDLDTHPCQETAFGGSRLDAAAAQTQPFFQDQFIDELRSIFVNGNVALGAISYRDILDHPDLDGLDVADAGSLLELGTEATGINVFFVRSLSPIGLQAFGPNPGPAGIGGTRRSGVVIGADTLCYRNWRQVARLTAHQLARYMGLYHNVEHTKSTLTGQAWGDLINDTDESSMNLMYYSEKGGGTQLTNGQRDILTRSGVLR